MEVFSLNGQWRLSFSQQNASAPASPDELSTSNLSSITASVPGNVELDLVRAGLLPELEIGENIFLLREYETYRWWYSREFAAPDLDVEQKLQLQFDGLDCLGWIWINGRYVGHCNNALIEHYFDITDFVFFNKPNRIDIRIDSALLAGRERVPEAVETLAGLTSRYEAQFIRKAPHCYGWDIMPRALSAGLWREVKLCKMNPTRFRDVYWFTQSVELKDSTARAKVGVDWDFCTDRMLTDDLGVNISLTDQDGSQVFSKQVRAIGTHARIEIDIENARLWWPRGYGDAHLYMAKLVLVDKHGDIYDSHECRLGVRTAQLERTEVLDSEGNGSFRFVINGCPVYAKGTNWVALDAFHSRDRNNYGQALDMLVELNCNMVRCWGGNVYEEDSFFEFCDNKGIMVWQDFAFACGIYPQDEEFQEKAYREAKSVVCRLRNYACIVLWAGNNENDLVQQWKGLDRYQDPNADLISRKVLAEAVRRNDLTREYLPSSPYISPGLYAVGADQQQMPEDHLWGLRPYFKDDFYSRSKALFVSEVGYHGCPCRESLEEMLAPEKIWPPHNSQWAAKSIVCFKEDISDLRHVGMMTKQLCHLFGDAPDDLDDYILASQITQMEAKKFFVEHWRLKEHSGGLLWWNLRDGWPVISDASVVDYYNRKKLAYEIIARSQADLCVIVDEPTNGIHDIYVINDTRQSKCGTVVIQDSMDNVLLEMEFIARPGEKNILAQIPENNSCQMWFISWDFSESVSGRNHYLCGRVPIELEAYKKFLPMIFS